MNSPNRNSKPAKSCWCWSVPYGADRSERTVDCRAAAPDGPYSNGSTSRRRRTYARAGRTAIPQSAVIAALIDPNTAEHGTELGVVAAGRVIGRQVYLLETGSEHEFEGAFAMFVDARPARFCWVPARFSSAIGDNSSAWLPAMRFPRATRSASTSKLAG
jgi:hypothetical protein